MSKFSQPIRFRPASTTASPADDPRRQSDRQMRAVSEMIEVGMKLAQTVRQRVLDGDYEAMRAFPNIASAVMQAMALQRRLTERTPAPPGAHSAAPADSKERVRQRREQLKSLVEGAVKEQAGGCRAVERRLLKLDEWLKDAALDADLAKRTTGEVAVDMCRQLGITPDIARWPQDALWEAAIHDATTRQQH